jgi:hypothetical protein
MDELIPNFAKTGGINSSSPDMVILPRNRQLVRPETNTYMAN